MRNSPRHLAVVLCAPLIFAAGMAQAAPTSSPRNYDCSKAGNANKAVCKGVASSSAAPTAKSASPATAPVPKPVAATRHYDCSKAGNANKAVCKGVAAPQVAAAPKAPQVATPPAVSATTTTRNYDCSKAGNANKAACKGAVSMPSAAPAARPVANEAPPIRPTTTRAAAPAQTSGRIVEWTTKTGKIVHYDCSKAGNFNKQACKQ
jgi:hypothetical protein